MATKDTYNTYFRFQGRDVHQSEKDDMGSSMRILLRNRVAGSWMVAPDGQTVCYLDESRRLVFTGLAPVEAGR